jgi:hypothetical protein
MQELEGSCACESQSCMSEISLSPSAIGNLGDEGVGVNSAPNIYIMVMDVRYHQVKNFLRTPNFHCKSNIKL